MALIRCEPCTYLRIGSEKSFIRTASHGIGSHFRCRVDVKHIEFLVQFQFKHTALYKSTGIDINDADVFDESIEGDAARCKVLAAEDIGESQFLIFL